MIRRENTNAAIELKSLNNAAVDQFSPTNISRSCKAVDHWVNGAAHARSQFYENCPLLTQPAKKKSVLISYSHHGEWGPSTACELSRFCAQHDIDYFIDEHTIPEGSAWPFWVEFAGIRQCGLFVLLLDKYSASSGWTATETEFALRSIYEVGSPYMVVVFEPSYLEDNDDRSETLPVFHAICSRLIGTYYGQGATALPMYAPQPCFGNRESLEHLKKQIRDMTFGTPGLMGYSVFRVLCRISVVMEHSVALLTALGMFLIYLKFFQPDVLLAYLSPNLAIALSSVFLFSFGYQLRVGWIVYTTRCQTAETTPLRHRINAIWSPCVLLISLLSTNIFQQLSWAARIASLLMPAFGWFANRFSAREDRLAPVWSIVSHSQAVYGLKKK